MVRHRNHVKTTLSVNEKMYERPKQNRAIATGESEATPSTECTAKHLPHTPSDSESSQMGYSLIQPASSSLILEIVCASTGTASLASKVGPTQPKNCTDQTFLARAIFLTLFRNERNAVAFARVNGAVGARDIDRSSPNHEAAPTESADWDSNKILRRGETTGYAHKRNHHTTNKQTKCRTPRVKTLKSPGLPLKHR